MYLDLKTIPFSKDISQIFAHRKEGKEKENLKEHLNLTRKYLEIITGNKKLPEIIDSLLKAISTDNSEFLKSMFYNAIYLHDLGKDNNSFQRHQMENEYYDETTESSNHSLPSAKKFVELFKSEIQKISDDAEFYKAVFVLHGFAYIISKHHGSLTSFENYSERIKDNNLVIDCQEIPEFEFYILTKLLFSLLISSDYYATAEYMTDSHISDFGLICVDKKKKYREKFESFGIVKNIRAFSKGNLNFAENDINKLRSEMFLESERNLLENGAKNIFYLEAPTGGGKTITSINLALRLLESDRKLNKLFYIFPFNTLVEQTKKTFDKIFDGAADIEVINSVNPIKEEGDGEKIDYSNSYLNRLFFHHPIVLTTHVSFFNILFGTGRDDNYPLWQLANSVVIIDEIQSYNNNLWWYMIEFFQKYASLLNIKFIIMSATLPRLDKLLEKPAGFVELITKKDDFFGHRLFKERVKADFSLLYSGNEKKSDEFRQKVFEKLLEIFCSKKSCHKKFLFEFIRKDSAREFFNFINVQSGGFEVFELTGDDNKAFREFVISETKKKDAKIIVVATQVIEAGVDIDMDIGFKDISNIDSEEQFMGRINRSCEKQGAEVYFFDLDDEQKIYRSDNRLEFNLRNKENRRFLEDKNFSGFYEKVLLRIENNGKSIKEGFKSKIECFRSLISKLNYSEIEKEMELISSQNYTLFFPFKIDIGKYKIYEFENIDKIFLTNGFLDGEKVWMKFKELNKIEDFTEMKVKKSKINSLMQFFTFNIIKYTESRKPANFSEEIGGVYYVPCFENYITPDLKFDRKEYSKDCNSNFF
jgi:CRISPR-associated endonuclease/helicase Cas3